MHSQNSFNFSNIPQQPKSCSQTYMRTLPKSSSSQPSHPPKPSNPQNQSFCKASNLASGLIGLADWGDPGFIVRKMGLIKPYFAHNRTLGFFAKTLKHHRKLPPKTGPGTSPWCGGHRGCIAPYISTSISKPSYPTLNFISICLN